MKRSQSLAVAFAAAFALFAFAGTALADTQYFSGGSYWGKTYRNNYRSSGCYDHYGSTSACYQGTWAETFVYTHYVSVIERPQKWIPTIPGNFSGPFYWYQKSDISNYNTSDVTVSSDYDAYYDHRADVNAKTIHGDQDTLTFVYTYDE